MEVLVFAVGTSYPASYVRGCVQHDIRTYNESVHNRYRRETMHQDLHVLLHQTILPGLQIYHQHMVIFPR
jgi:hypothetical protein